MLNSLFFWVLFFWVKTFFSFFSLYTHSLWNISLDSWSAWKFNQNGILVCEIRWLFEFSKFLNDGVFVVVKKLTSSPFDQWDPFLSYLQNAIAPPIFRSAPLFFYFFLAFFFIISLAFIYLFLSFFSLILSISRNMQHYLLFFIFLYLFYLVYFSVISYIFSFFIYLLYFILFIIFFSIFYFLHFYLFTLFTCCFNF